MLNVTFDPKRPADRGQYFVELIDIRHFERGLGGENWDSNRLGYWCDKGHLQTIAHAVLCKLNPGLSYPELRALLDGKGSGPVPVSRP